MANNINRLGFNIAGYNYTRQEETAAKSSPEKKEHQINNKKQYAANDVLGFMAASNADMIPVKAQKTVDVSKYVTKEQEERIAGFMKGFEADFENASNIAVDEFGVSQNVADKIALAYINSSY